MDYVAFERKCYRKKFCIWRDVVFYLCYVLSQGEWLKQVRSRKE